MVVTTEFDRICTGYIYETARAVQLADELADVADRMLRREAEHCAGLVCQLCADRQPRRFISGKLVHVYGVKVEPCSAARIHGAIAAGRYARPGQRVDKTARERKSEAQLSLGEEIDHG